MERTKGLYLWGEIKHQEFVVEQEKNRALLIHLHSREGKNLIKALEPLGDFANPWRLAEDSGHLVEQKRLLHLAMIYFSLRGNSIVEIHASRESGHAFSRACIWVR